MLEIIKTILCETEKNLVVLIEKQAITSLSTPKFPLLLNPSNLQLPSLPALCSAQRLGPQRSEVAIDSGTSCRIPPTSLLLTETVLGECASALAPSKTIFLSKRIKCASLSPPRGTRVTINMYLAGIRKQPFNSV